MAWAAASSAAIDSAVVREVLGAGALVAGLGSAAAAAATATGVAVWSASALASGARIGATWAAWVGALSSRLRKNDPLRLKTMTAADQAMAWIIRWRRPFPLGA